jgi:hypothetical protein
MALLYDPGAFMPKHESDFDGASWMMGWDDGAWCMHDIRPGGAVYLVSTEHQRIVWETEVVESFAVPYEAVDDLALEVFLRWGLAIDTGTLPPSGYCVGWRARPIERCSTTLAPDLDDTSGEDLSLNGFQFTTEASPQFLRRWSLPTPATHWCTGRVEFGWFSRTT